MFAVLLVCALGVARGAKWPAHNGATLVDAVRRAAAGDTIELEPGDYVLRPAAAGGGAMPALHIDKPLVVRSRDARQRAVLRGDGAEVLIAVTSSAVELRDVIVGRQASGGDERTIDVYVAAGSQALPASASAAYGGAAANTLASRGELLSARALQTAAGAADALRKRSTGVARVLANVRLTNVDFTRSRSGQNVAFAAGGYADVAIERCAFGRADAPHINALVAVGDAAFDALRVRHCALAGGAHVLIGSPTVGADALALNYWGGDAPAVWLAGEQRAAETYCLDSACARYAPVVDGDAPEHAYASLGEAFAAGVRRVRVTDDVSVDRAAHVTRVGTTLEGGESCDGAPLVRIGANAGVVSANGALAGVRNLRVALDEARATGFVFTDGKPQRLGAAKHAQALLGGVGEAGGGGGDEQLVVFDGVSVLGRSAEHRDQAAVVVNAANVRVELLDTVVVQVAHGAVVHRGALTVADSTFFGASRAAVYVETTTHQTALRVAGASFVGGDAAIELGAGGSSTALHALSVKCSQFLFNARRTPIVAHDCAKHPALCSAALRYNTIVSEHAALTADADADAHMLRAGANHVEHGRARTDYVYFGEPRHFSLADTQGRLSWASGALIDAADAAFLLASYAPLRAECLPVAESVDATPQAAVVSDVLELRSDSLLHQCSGVGVRFRVGGDATSLAVYGVARLGSTDVAWSRQLASASSAADGQTTLDATLITHDSNERHQHRVVVVALDLLPDVERAALASGAALLADAPRAAAHRLCVVCAGGALSAHELDEYCGGTSDNVRDSFDAAYDELHMGAGVGAPRHEPVGLLVAGVCAVERADVTIDQNEHIEGLGESRRGTLVLAGSVRFAPRAAKSSLRYIEVRSAADCAVDVASSDVQLGPTVAYSTLASSLCIDGRQGGRYVNNEIGGGVRAAFGGAGPEAPVLIEANRVAGGDAELANDGVAPVDVRFDRNQFVGARGVTARGAGLAVRVTNNGGVALLESTDGAKLAALDNAYADGVHISLGDSSSLANSEPVALVAADVVVGGKVRVSNVALDAASSVAVVGIGSAVVLRNVALESVRSLHVERSERSPCAAFEAAATGIDLPHSRIVNGAGAVVLSADEQRTIAADASAYWRAADGTLAHCADGAAVERSAERCACPGQPQAVAAAEQQGAAAAAAEQQGAAAEQGAAAASKPKSASRAKVLEHDSDDSEHSSSHTLTIVLIVIGAVLLLCILVACIWGCANKSATSADTAVLASRAPARRTSAPVLPVSAPSPASASSALSALRVRKTAKKAE